MRILIFIFSIFISLVSCKKNEEEISFDVKVNPWSIMAVSDTFNIRESSSAKGYFTLGKDSLVTLSIFDQKNKFPLGIVSKIPSQSEFACLCAPAIIRFTNGTAVMRNVRLIAEVETDESGDYKYDLSNLEFVKDDTKFTIDFDGFVVPLRDSESNDFNFLFTQDIEYIKIFDTRIILEDIKTSHLLSGMGVAYKDSFNNRSPSTFENQNPSVIEIDEEEYNTILDLIELDN